MYCTPFMELQGVLLTKIKLLTYLYIRTSIHGKPYKVHTCIITLFVLIELRKICFGMIKYVGSYWSHTVLCYVGFFFFDPNLPAFDMFLNTYSTIELIQFVYVQINVLYKRLRLMDTCVVILKDKVWSFIFLINRVWLVIKNKQYKMEIDINHVSDLGVTQFTVVSEKWNTTCNEFLVIKVEVTWTSKNYSISKADNVEQ